VSELALLLLPPSFAGQGSLNRPFSQGDYLRNQMAARWASQGSQFANRWQQPISIPIVAVDAIQPITIILEPLTIAGKASRKRTSSIATYPGNYDRRTNPNRPSKTS